MSSRTSWVLAFAAASILVVVLFVPVCFAVSVDEASVTLSAADQNLNSAFTAVAKAGDSGANVTLLLGKLSVAGDYLSRAQIAFRLGDYDNAYSNALECSNSLAGVFDEAMQLQVSGKNDRNERILLTTVGSGVGLVLLCVIGFFGWRFLSDRYRKQVLNMKPAMEGQQ